MALKPLLKVKVDELFMRWLSEPETQTILHETLQQIVNGSNIAQSSQQIAMSCGSSMSSHVSQTDSSMLLRLPTPQKSFQMSSVTSKRHPTGYLSRSRVSHLYNYYHISAHIRRPFRPQK